jgi:glyoxylate reductase
MTPRVLITGPIKKEWLEELEKIADVTVWHEPAHFLMPRERMISEIGKYEGIINFADVKTDEEFIQNANKLKIIANCAIGYDNLNLPLLTKNHIWASNAPGFFDYPVAEYVLAGVMTISRRLLEADDFIRQGKWTAFRPGDWDGTSLREKMVGIVGFGTIGKQFGDMAKAIGAKVIHFTPTPKEEGWVPFDELISISDIISIHVPLTNKTINLFNSEVITKTKKGAILVNTSRGAVLDQDALIRALQSGKMGGAVLDVFQDEPNVPNDLKKMKNVLLTPHIAGGTKSSREGSIKRAIQNVVAVLRNNRPIDALNELSDNHR